MQSPQIIIAGASGYIGQALIPLLLETFPQATITALCRSQPKNQDSSQIIWKSCDLFSLKSLEEAIPPKVDLAFYLVHSMGATAHLDQGSFADYDLLLADNFARAIGKASIQHLIYLGGLIPEAACLSRHLRSRLEVEEIFSHYHLPTTIFRAAMILGEGGSSFQILLKLVKYLPVMICPSWTQTLTTPVDLATVLSSMISVALNPSQIGKVYDLAGCEPITYLDMMRKTAAAMKKKRTFFTVPFFTPTLSRLWVSLITNSPKNLVYPLIESLEHVMVARKSHVFSKESFNRSYTDLLKNASLKTQPSKSIFHFKPKRRTVRSVQRLPLPEGKNAEWVKMRYSQWLPRFLKPLIRVNLHKDSISFCMISSRWLLLQLRLSSDRSNIDRQLLYITKGLLVGEDNRGRLEFRVVLNRRFVIAAIHDFKPALPWFIYRYTQAQIHLFIMNAFGKELGR
jgi:uncharacterized protein YbjT (DUF2867 family)